MNQVETKHRIELLDRCAGLVDAMSDCEKSVILLESDFLNAQNELEKLNGVNCG